MSQDFADQAMLEMPEIMNTDLINAKSFGQMRTDGFNQLSDTATKLTQGLRDIREHILSGGSDDLDPVTVKQNSLAIGIDESLVC